jgi:hypothetical protein
VKKRQEGFGYQPAVFMNEGKGADTHQHNKDAFEELKTGYGSQYAPLTNMGICFLSVWHMNTDRCRVSRYNEIQNRIAGSTDP